MDVRGCFVEMYLAVAMYYSMLETVAIECWQNLSENFKMIRMLSQNNVSLALRNRCREWRPSVKGG